MKGKNRIKIEGNFDVDLSKSPNVLNALDKMRAKETIVGVSRIDMIRIAIMEAARKRKIVL